MWSVNKIVVLVLVSYFISLFLLQRVLLDALWKEEKNNAPVADTTTTIYVVSLQGVAGADPENEGRFDDFRRVWNKTCHCETIRLKQCPGGLDERRGFGLTRAFVSCFQQALNDTHSAEDVSIFLEDDARLFLPDFCDATKRNEIWRSMPEDAFLVLLGGHTWEFRGENTTLRDARIQYPSFQFLESSFSFGSYAFAIPRVNLRALLDGYLWDLDHPQLDFYGHDKLSPDKSFYDHAGRNGQKVYAANPLVFFHEAGYSNTWKTERDALIGDTLHEKEEYEYSSNEDENSEMRQGRNRRRAVLCNPRQMNCFEVRQN